MPGVSFFFVHDARGRRRFFSTDPVRPPDVARNRTREIWETAKRKLMVVLPAPVLRKELAFDRIRALPAGEPVRVFHAGSIPAKKEHARFSFFLQRERTRHILILAGEAVLLPLAGLAAVLPGPNVFFYVLAVVMFVQWQAFRGINRLFRADVDFVPDPAVEAWERTVAEGRTADFGEAVTALERAHGLKDLKKVLWRPKRSD